MEYLYGNVQEPCECGTLVFRKLEIHGQIIPICATCLHALLYITKKEWSPQSSVLSIEQEYKKYVEQCVEEEKNPLCFEDWKYYINREK